MKLKTWIRALIAGLLSMFLTDKYRLYGGSYLPKPVSLISSTGWWFLNELSCRESSFTTAWRKGAAASQNCQEFTDGDNFGRFELVLLRLIWLKNSRHKRKNLEKWFQVRQWFTRKCKGLIKNSLLSYMNCIFSLFFCETLDNFCS